MVDESKGMKAWGVKHHAYMRTKVEEQRRARDLAAGSTSSTSDPPNEPKKWTKAWLRERVDHSLNMAELEMDNIAPEDIEHFKSLIYTHLEIWK